MSLTLRAASPADAATLGPIAYEAFKAIADRHGFPPDFPDPDIATGLIEHLVGRPDVYGVVAEQNGRVIGSNFLLEGAAAAGVGPITVDPAAQNATVGRRLMQAVLDRARDRGIPAVRLVQAAYHARSMSLYAKLGFVVREPLVVFQGKPLGLTIDGCTVAPAGLDDADAAAALCFQVHGHARHAEFVQAVTAGAAMVVRRGGRVTGYTTGIGFLGHAVGETTTDIKALIGASPAFPGPGFLLPTRNAELFRWGLDHGLRIVMPLTFMSYGLYNEPQGAYLPSILL